MKNETQEKRLVLAAQKGDQQAFEKLYELYHGSVYFLARTTLKSDDAAEDVLQQVFITVWQKLSELKDPAAFGTWIRRITVNKCYSCLRASKPVVSLEDEENAAILDNLETDLMLPEVYAVRDDLRERLAAILASLSDVQRQTVQLFYYDTLSVEEIAKVMDCSVGTVKSRLFLARKAIRTEIEESERKSGQKFYGLAGLPLLSFSELLHKELEKNTLSAAESAALYQNICSSAGIVASAAAAVTAAVIPLAVKITAGVLVAALAVGGGILAAARLKKEAPLEPVETVTESLTEPQESETAAAPVESESEAETESETQPVLPDVTLDARELLEKIPYYGDPTIASMNKAQAEAYAALIAEGINGDRSEVLEHVYDYRLDEAAAFRWDTPCAVNGYEGGYETDRALAFLADFAGNGKPYLVLRSSGNDGGFTVYGWHNGGVTLTATEQAYNGRAFALLCENGTNGDVVLVKGGDEDAPLLESCTMYSIVNAS